MSTKNLVKQLASGVNGTEVNINVSDLVSLLEGSLGEKHKLTKQ